MPYRGLILLVAKCMNKIFYVIDFLVLALCLAWFIHAPDFEPPTMIVATIGHLLILYQKDNKLVRRPPKPGGKTQTGFSNNFTLTVIVIVIQCLIIALIIVRGNFPPLPFSSVPKVTIASLNRVDISPEGCKEKSPCLGLKKRDNILHLEINKQGYAAAYLKEYKYFYNQEGELIIKNGTEGDIGLWPGTADSTAHDVYKLYIVTSDKEIPTFPDSAKLPDLPKGRVWGPIYLQLIPPPR